MRFHFNNSEKFEFGLYLEECIYLWGKGWTKRKEDNWLWSHKNIDKPLPHLEALEKTKRREWIKTT